MRPTGVTYDLLPMPERVLNEPDVANDLQGDDDDQLRAGRVPSGTPPAACQLHG